MNQIANEIADKILKKDEESLAKQLEIDPEFHKTVRSMLVDYVANDMSLTLLAEKYHVTLTFIKKIAVKFKFEQRKKEYDKKLLDTVLGKAQKQQAAVIAKITTAVNTQVNRIIKLQDSNDGYLISNGHMKDLVSILTLFSKEYRLDNDQLTDSVGFNVRVEFPNHVPLITNNNQRPIDIEVEKEIAEVKEITQEQSKEEPQLNEEEPSVSNASFFGSILE